MAESSYTITIKAPNKARAISEAHRRFRGLYEKYDGYFVRDTEWEVVFTNPQNYIGPAVPPDTLEEIGG